MTINTISTLPTAPARTDAPATFISRADAFLAALVTMQGELNTSIGQMNTDIAGVNTDATTASNAATAAAASQSAAEAASNATEWVSGTSYSAGDVVYSPITYLSYRAIQATSGTTDPSLDTANWTGLNVSGGSGEQTFTATGAISTGDLVALNSDGTVSVIAETAGPPDLGSPTQATGTGAINGEVTACYDPVQDAIFVAYRDQSSGGYLYGLVGTISGSTITWGTPAAIYSSAVNYMDSVFVVNDNKIALVANQGTSNLRIFSITVDASTRTFTTPGANLAIAGNHSWCRITYDSTSERVVTCSWSGTNVQLEYMMGSFSGGAFTKIVDGSAYVSGTSTIRTPDITYDAAQDKILIVFSDENRYGAARVGTVGASSITWGTAAVFENSAAVDDGELHLRYDPTSQKSIVAYRLSAAGYANTITISGTTPSFGTKTNTGNRTAQSLNYDSGAGKVIESYKKSGAPDNDYLYFDTYSVSGTTVVVDSSTALTTGTYTASTTNRHFEIVYDTEGVIVQVYDDDTNSTITGIAYDKETVTTNAADFVGIAKEDINNAASGTIYVNSGISGDQTGLTAKTGYYVTSTGGLSSTATGYPFVGYATSATDILIGGKNLPSVTGQSGKFLTTDGTNLSWANDNAGSWQFINSTTVSGTVSSIDINSGIDGTYDMYVLQLIKVEPDATGGRYMYLRTSTDGGSTFDSSGYSYGSGTVFDSSASVSINASTSDSFIRLSDAGLGSNAGEFLTGFIYLVKPSEAANFVCFWDLAGLTYPTSKALRVFGSGQRETAADVDAIRIYMSSGNIVGGTVRLYGIVNS